MSTVAGPGAWGMGQKRMERNMLRTTTMFSLLFPIPAHAPRPITRALVQ
jgi:hypothetical protein